MNTAKLTLEQVLALSNEDVDVAIAEKRGYTFKDESARYPDEEDWQKYRAVYLGDGFIGLQKPGWSQVPDYCNNLNACMKVVRGIPATSRDTYQAYLSRIVEREHRMATVGWLCITAEACQHAEALLLTLQ